jgi:hypothetical protein
MSKLCAPRPESFGDLAKIGTLEREPRPGAGHPLLEPLAKILE